MADPAGEGCSVVRVDSPETERREGGRSPAGNNSLGRDGTEAAYQAVAGAPQGRSSPPRVTSTRAAAAPWRRPTAAAPRAPLGTRPPPPALVPSPMPSGRTSVCGRRGGFGEESWGGWEEAVWGVGRSREISSGERVHGRVNQDR